MRSFIAFFAHETNSFSPIPTEAQSFENLGVYRPSMGPPANCLAQLKGAADLYRAAVERGHEAVVGTCALAQPSAPCIQKDYEALRDEILTQLKLAESIDMVLIMMHGAMMAQGYDDCEGDMMRRMRQIVGPDVPIGLLLDLHCNMTQEMLDHATLIIPCKEYPHTDFATKADELYGLTEKIARGDLQAVHSIFRVPVLGLFQTVESPMKEFVAQMNDAEKAEAVLSVGLCHGFPWADFPDTGAAVVVYTNDDKSGGDSLAQQLGKDFFGIRHEAQSKARAVEDVIPQLMHHESGTIVVADMADNAGGGAPSDSTFILRAFLDAGIEGALFGLIWDPESIELAFVAGEGATLKLRIGGKNGPFSGEPIALEVTVNSLRESASQPHIADGYPVKLGRTAVVEARGVRIVLNDVRQQPFHPEAFITAGVDPWDMRIVVVKSSYHFYAGFGERARQVIYVDTPGLLNNDPAARPYTRITRPLWPLDDIAL